MKVPQFLVSWCLISSPRHMAKSLSIPMQPYPTPSIHYIIIDPSDGNKAHISYIHWPCHIQVRTKQTTNNIPIFFGTCYDSITNPHNKKTNMETTKKLHSWSRKILFHMISQTFPSRWGSVFSQSKLNHQRWPNWSLYIISKVQILG